MRCRHVRRLLAIQRELQDEERRLVEEHVARCTACARLQASFAQQDALLAALPSLASPSPPFSHLRATAFRGAPAVPRRAWAMAVGLALLLLSLGGGTVAAAAAALPGDALYPLKREIEQVSLQLVRDPASQQALERRWAARRLAEAQRLAEAGREAELEIEATLLEATEGAWRLDGLAVRVAEELWPGPPPVHSVVRLAVEIRDGQIIARAARQIRNPDASGPPSPAAPGKSEGQRPASGNGQQSLPEPEVATTPSPTADMSTTPTEPPRPTPPAPPGQKEQPAPPEDRGPRATPQPKGQPARPSWVPTPRARVTPPRALPAPPGAGPGGQGQ